MPRDGQDQVIKTEPFCHLVRRRTSTTKMQASSIQLYRLAHIQPARTHPPFVQVQAIAHALPEAKNCPCLPFAVPGRSLPCPAELSTRSSLGVLRETMGSPARGQGSNWRLVRGKMVSGYVQSGGERMGWDRIDVQCVLQMLVDLHDGRLVAAAVAVVWR